jgi:hypothetical protein
MCYKGLGTIFFTQIIAIKYGSGSIIDNGDTAGQVVMVLL